MPSGRADWLDRLARRAAGNRIQRSPRGGPHRDSDVAGSGDVGEDRFTRATSLKLAVIGAASLSLGLWRAPVARAQSEELARCFELCGASYRERVPPILRRRLRACEREFSPANLAKKPGWRRLRRRLRLTPVGWNSLVDQLRSNCFANARSESRADRKDCEETCERTCPRRSVQSASSTTAPSCQYTPPPKPSPPAVPPAPATEGGYCSDCAKVTPAAFCDPCPTVDTGFSCCALPPVNGKSPCCSG
jgi:hypothetical protein